MQQHLLWVVFVAYFTFFNKCETKHPQTENSIPYVMSQLFENRSKPPIILYLEPRQTARATEELPEDLSELQVVGEREENNHEHVLRTTQTDERAYLLYHLLRTTIDEEEINPEAAEQLHHTKEFLRKAFIGRCRQLDTCRRECPKPVAKFSCTMQCKQIFDDLDECDKPKENKCGVKCGHTMPPTWLL